MPLMVAGDQERSESGEDRKGSVSRLRGQEQVDDGDGSEKKGAESIEKIIWKVGRGGVDGAEKGEAEMGR